MFDVLADCGNIAANGTLTVTGNVEFDGGSFIFNQSSADVDFRIESNGNANAFFVDAGNDRIGRFTASPAVAFDVTGAAKISGAVDLDGGAFKWNDKGGGSGFNWGGDWRDQLNKATLGAGDSRDDQDAQDAEAIAKRQGPRSRISIAPGSAK